MVRKAQVTIWIIVGILLLLVISVSYYLITQKVLVPIEDTIVVPPAVQPVYDYTQNCVNKIAEQGLTKIGLQGGYMTIPFSITRMPTSYLRVDPEGILKVPYWYFNGESRIPTLEFIRRELELYIHDNLDNCILDFEAFDNMEIRERSKRKTAVSFLEKDVLIELDWDIEVAFPNEEIVVIPKLISRLPVQFKKIYELAKSTMEAENEFGLLENVTIDLLAMNEKVPMDSMELHCGPKRWPIFEVKQEIERMLQYNIPQIRIKGTDSLPFNEDDEVYENLAEERKQIIEALEAGATNPSFPEDTPEDAYYYFRMNFDVGAHAEELKIGFQFMPQWGMELDIQPRDGGMLKSSKVQGNQEYLSFICINQYHFVYDLVYPVMMNIKDPTAFKGKGYSFQFAFPVIIDNNEPRRELRGYRNFITSFADTDYCKRLSGPEVSLRAEGFEAGLMFAIEVDDVNMTFSCGTEICNLGKTTAADGHYQLKTAMPMGCGNPFITASKSGYLSDRKVLISSQDDKLVLVLTKLKEFDIEVVKHRYYDIDNRLDPTPVPLGDYEEALIYFRLEDTSVPFEQFGDFPKGNLPNLQLAEAEKVYDITVFVRDAFGNLLAGYNADDITFTFDEVDQGSTIVLHTVEPTGMDNTDEGKAQVAGLIYGPRFAQQLRPTFK